MGKYHKKISYSNFIYKYPNATAKITTAMKN